MVPKIGAVRQGHPSPHCRIHMRRGLAEGFESVECPLDAVGPTVASTVHGPNGSLPLRPSTWVMALEELIAATSPKHARPPTTPPVRPREARPSNPKVNTLRPAQRTAPTNLRPSGPQEARLALCPGRRDARQVNFRRSDFREKRSGRPRRRRSARRVACRSPLRSRPAIRAFP